MDLEEKVEKLAEKVENLEEEKEKLERENRKLRKQIEPERHKKADSQEEALSRRSFLKKIGAGALGIGALSLAPAASQLRITESGIFGKSDNPIFKDVSDGQTRFGNNLNLSGKNLTNVDSIDGVDFSAHINDTSAHHAKTQPSEIDSSNWSDYEIQKDGSDGSGVINFKT